MASGRFLAPDADALAVAGGNHVVIAHANGEYSYYMHLAQGSVAVKPGDRVKRGQPIAAVGGTGEWPEVHLHFQVSSSPPTDIMGHTIPVRFVNAPPADGVVHSREPGSWVRALPGAP